MDAILVYNDSAGSGDHSSDELIALLASSGWQAQLISSDDERMEDILKEANGPVIVAGGDGTVAKTVVALRGRAVPIAILPIGGSNNIARAFGLTARLENLIAGLSEAPIAALDIGVAEGDWGSTSFVEAAGSGALTDALCNMEGHASSTQEKLAMGRDALADQLAGAEAYDYILCIDGRESKDAFLMLEVLNIPAIGPRLRLAPDADPGDGLLHAVTLSIEQRGEFLIWLKEPEGPPPVSRVSGREIRILEGPDKIRLDDPKSTVERCRKPVRLYLRPNPAPMLIPNVREETT